MDIFLSIREKAIFEANVFGKQQVYWYLAHTNFVWFWLKSHYYYIYKAKQRINIINILGAVHYAVIGSDNGLSLGPAPSHYLNQSWLIVIEIRNGFQWYLNQNTNMFIEEMILKNVVCKLTAFWCPSQCVKTISDVTSNYGQVPL